MFLTQNVMDVTWSEKALRDAFLWDTTPFTLPATPKISVCCLCANFFTHVMRGTQTQAGWSIPGIAEPNVLKCCRQRLSIPLHRSDFRQSSYWGWHSPTVWQTERQIDTDDCVVYQNSRLWPQHESAFLTKNLMTFAPVSSLLRPNMLSSRIDLNLDPSIKPITLSNFSVSVKEKLVS